MAADRDIRAYGLSHLGKSLLWAGSDALTIFLLISRGGMAPALAGSLFMVMLIWNAICDLLVGRWHDRRRASGRSALPIIAAAILVACICFPASLLAPKGDIVWILASGLLFRTAFAIFDVPHNALIAELGRTPDQGMRLAQYRTVGSGLASIVIGLIAMPMLGVGEPGRMMLVTMLSGLALASALLMIPYLRLARGVSRVAAPVRATNAITARFPGKPEGLKAFFLSSAIGMVALGAISKAPPHLDLISTQGAGAALLILMCGRFASVAIAGPLVSRLGAHRMLVVSYLAMAGLIFGLAPIASLGGPALLLWIGLLGVAIGMIAVISWVRLPELARALSEQTRTAAFGAYTMISKFALGLSGLVLTLAFGAPLTAGSDGVMGVDALLRLGIVAGVISVAAAMVLTLTDLRLGSSRGARAP